jgi:hypothetical protein
VTVVDITEQPKRPVNKRLTHKRSHKAVRERLPTLQSIAEMDGRTGTAQFFLQMAAEIERDLGGRNRLSRIELALIEAFVGAALLARRALPIKDGDSYDVPAFTSATLVMSRIGGQLGLPRRQRQVGGVTLGEVLRQGQRDG